MILPQNWEHGRAAPIIICHMSAWAALVGGVLFSPLHHPSMPEAGGRAGPETRKMGKLPLPSISCNTQESRLCTSHGQHNRANPIARV